MNLSAILQKIQTWRLFSRREEEVSTFSVIKWWELRRVPYNLIVGLTGIFTCLVIFALLDYCAAKWGEPADLPDPPILPLLGVIIYGVAANVFFTGGWIGELVARKIWQEKARYFSGPAFFFGLLFSIILTLAPAAFFTGILILRLVFGHS